jgi:Flp pilus assembly pilin Flp
MEMERPEWEEVTKMELSVKDVWNGVRRGATACMARLAGDESGQDLIEYALMAATIAVAVGAIFPTSIAPNISTIFSKVSSSLGSASSF